MNRRTHRAEILAILVKARGAWVPLPEIMRCAAQYNSRLFEIRKMGFRVENKTEQRDGEKHSWFRLVSDQPAHSVQPPTASTESSTGGPTHEDNHGLFGDIGPAGGYPD